MPDDFGSDEVEINGKKWSWKDFKTTEGFPISEQLLDWVIGQEHALRECRLCVDEWIAKLEWLKKREWWKVFEVKEVKKDFKIFGHHLFYYGKERFFSPKPNAKEYLPSGPFLMLLGDAGTGKSLIGRAMAGYMSEVYKKYNINMYDVCTWLNKTMPSEPRITIYPTPKGREVVSKLRKEEIKRGRLVRWMFNGLIVLMIGFGGFILSYLLTTSLYSWFTNAIDWTMTEETNILTHIQTEFPNIFAYLISVLMNNVTLAYLGIAALSMGGMIWIFSRIFGNMFGGKGTTGIGNSESIKSPKLLIDNSINKAPFIDATGHGSSMLFGSIAWDPFQTGGMGTPEHQRVTAGDVHKAHLGVLYIDEIKNLIGAEAVTLLTVLEDGQLPISLRSHSGISGDTAAMAVATEPVPCMVFFIAAGNMDSVPNIHPALMDRIRGYGKIVYMNNDMPNTVENRRKYVQFMAQEIKRFNLLPFSRDACMAIVDEARRKSGRNDKLTCKFRPMISILKTASVLASNEGATVVERRHISEAICTHCKSISLQVLEREVEKKSVYQTLRPDDEPIVGQIHGLAVIGNSESEENIGTVLPIKASMIKCKKGEDGYFNVTGVTTKEGSWVQGSIDKVGHAFLQITKVPLNKYYRTLIDFSQHNEVEGPSAGVAMLLSILSVYKKQKIRQDVAVTGEINIEIGGKVEITPVGGVHYKIMAAQTCGFKKVCIPEKNFEHDIVPSDYKIKVVPCKTINDYEREVYSDE